MNFINNTLISYPSHSTTVSVTDSVTHSVTLQPPKSVGVGSRQTWLVFAAAVFLVSVPVFIQAPLVRLFPWWSLAASAGWLWLGFFLLARPKTEIWGDLLIGFTWSWMAGSLYWGWLRWEPLLHLPVEAIGVPFAVWCLCHNRCKIGSLFYLGSLFGTVVTDLYFYLVDLIPHWRALMQANPEQASTIFQGAIAQIQTPWGCGWAIFLASLLLAASLLPMRSRQLSWWALSGAVLSTILVDSLFWVAASTAA